MCMLNGASRRCSQHFAELITVILDLQNTYVNIRSDNSRPLCQVNNLTLHFRFLELVSDGTNTRTFSKEFPIMFQSVAVLLLALKLATMPNELYRFALIRTIVRICTQGWSGRPE